MCVLKKDYYATIYSAEIVNSLTNLLFVYLAARGVRNCLEHGHDTVFLVAFMGYGITGLGSMAFHSTLKYHTQLWDELAMIYSTCLVCSLGYGSGNGGFEAGYADVFFWF